MAGGVLNNDVSLDQLIVQQTMPDTRFSSLQWSAGEPGPCDVGGSSCAYTQSISWTGPASPLVPTIDPRAAFERLFGNGVDGPRRARRGDPAQLAAVHPSTSCATMPCRCRPSSGHADQMRLEEYFTALTELEKSLSTAGADCDAEADPPVGGLDYPARSEAFNQLIKLAFQCDQTRFLSFMIEFGLSGRSHEFIDAPGSPITRCRTTGISPGATASSRSRPGRTSSSAGCYSSSATPRGPRARRCSTRRSCSRSRAWAKAARTITPTTVRCCSVALGAIAADGRQIAYPAGSPPPLSGLHVSLLEAFGVQGAFGPTGAIFGDDGVASIPGVVV